MTHATQEEFPSLNKKESKTHQRGRKEDSKEPKSLYSEEEGDQPSLLQRGKYPYTIYSFDIMLYGLVIFTKAAPNPKFLILI